MIVRRVVACALSFVLGGCAHQHAVTTSRTSTNFTAVRAATPTPVPLLLLAGDETSGTELIPGIATTFLSVRGARGIVADFTTPAPSSSPGTPTPAPGVLVSGTTPSGRTITVRMDFVLAKEAALRLSTGQIDVAVIGHQEIPRTACRLRPAPHAASHAAEPSPSPSATASAYDTFAALPLARAPLHIVVARLNPVRGISFKQLREIYAGRTTDWKDLGRKAGPINLYGLNTTSIAHRLIAADILEPPPTDVYRSNENHFSSLSGLRAALASDPNGIGYTTGAKDTPPQGLRYVDPTIRGTRDTPDDYTVPTGDYPLLLTPTLYWRRNDPNPAVAELANIAGSPETEVRMAPKTAGLWPLEPRLLVPPSQSPNLPGALRVSTTVRFTGSARAIDADTAIQLDQLACYTLELDPSQGQLRHVVFSAGSDDADTIAGTFNRALQRRGIDPGTFVYAQDAFAGDLPRGLRRRVETWIVPCVTDFTLPAPGMPPPAVTPSPECVSPAPRSSRGAAP